MKKIDFSKIVVKDINGEPYTTTKKVGNDTVVEPYDFAKILGNGMFYGGEDLRISELGQQIYHKQPVELSDSDIASIREFINKNFVPFVLISVNPQLDKMLSEKK